MGCALLFQQFQLHHLSDVAFNLFSHMLISSTLGLKSMAFMVGCRASLY
jgi:hypothetical protein